MYGIISDCDEGEWSLAGLNTTARALVRRLICAVFNFYEPLHYFQNNSGFQTWELSPQFAVRSWAYVLLHWPFAHIGPQVLHLSKVSPDTAGSGGNISDSTSSQRQAFFALRLTLGAICSFCEARFMRTIADTINDRVARYTFFMLLLSAGMWSASVCERTHMLPLQRKYRH
jgi:alpha-1,2-mannosyltransferase